MFTDDNWWKPRASFGATLLSRKNLKRPHAYSTASRTSISETSNQWLTASTDPLILTLRAAARRSARLNARRSADRNCVSDRQRCDVLYRAATRLCHCLRTPVSSGTVQRCARTRPGRSRDRSGPDRIFFGLPEQDASAFGEDAIRAKRVRGVQLLLRFACARRIVRQLTPARMKASTKRSSRRSRKLSAGLLSIGRSSPCQTASE